MPARKGRTCFVLLCKGGYKSSEIKVSLFLAPTDPFLLQEWSRNIKRDDKVLDNTCVVCSRHFDERYILRTFKHFINEEAVELECERPALTDDVVPTIFPDALLYFTKHVPKRRKDRDLTHYYAPPPKRMALDEGMAECEPTESFDVQSASETSAHPFSNVSPPSAFCTEIVLYNEPGELCFGWYIRGKKFRDVLVHKHVTIAVCSETTQKQAQTSLCRTYCRNVKVN
ncbi:hypothetical protein HPB51_011513 [Rhipicephalus microplus]|uniref:THAP-type domain-containing protein n=1 Tax=Rhipicephalus microplus TaxID=6941 RepID=A0A9J6E1R5_RHIMP|nr:hypothetical protein HPB51_011513 [Rhipicephalus microplus]